MSPQVRSVRRTSQHVSPQVRSHRSQRRKPPGGEQVTGDGRTSLQGLGSSPSLMFLTLIPGRSLFIQDITAPSSPLGHAAIGGLGRGPEVGV
ncbi:hypothetical protein GDO81_001400 [Engystomops pustulosus]|uniref:Uncharacterized protein n=1 Tax=Engystomops pustulosus TaxID=76066 RepID=A0AAV7DDL6_ENGPU|nr:hypothetical protein GDO81_001400 [Engystomops pustulosus]